MQTSTNVWVVTVDRYGYGRDEVLGVYRSKDAALGAVNNDIASHPRGRYSFTDFDWKEFTIDGI